MRGILAIALAACSALAQATTYYADPNGGGAASCVDNGANVCTLARAVAVAGNGDTVQAACGTYDMAAATLNITTNITIAPVTALCATIIGTNATAPVTLTVANNANTLTFGAFVVTGSGSSSRTIFIPNYTGYDATIILSGTSMTSSTNSAIGDSTTRGKLKFLNVIGSGTLGVQGFIYDNANSGQVGNKVKIVDGLTGTFTQGTSGAYVVWITRTTTTPTNVYGQVTNSNFSLTVPAGLGAAATGYGVFMNNVSDAPNFAGTTAHAEISNNTITMDCQSNTSGECAGILIQSANSATPCDYTQIYNNTFNGPIKSGYLIAVGQTNAAANYCGGVNIYGNTVVNTYYDGVATPHNISITNIATANTSPLLVQRNLIKGSAVGVVLAVNDAARVTGNLLIGQYYAPLFSKGSGTAVAPLIANNTVVMDDSIYGVRIGAYGCLAVAVSGATNNAATTFANNACYVASGTGWKYVVDDASQVATFKFNDYYSLATLTNPWSYQGVTQANLAGWQGAQEASAIGTTPGFVCATLTNPVCLKLTSTAGNRRAGIGLNIGAVQDYNNFAFSSPPNIGAYASVNGDIAVDRNAATRSASAARTAATARTARTQ